MRAIQAMNMLEQQYDDLEEFEHFSREAAYITDQIRKEYED